MFLADACALIVFLTQPDLESAMPKAASVMRDSEIAVLPTTVWEITRTAALGKLPRVWRRWPTFSALLADQGFRQQPFEWADAEAANNLPNMHKDPMDRMLIASAQRSKMTIITSGRVFAAYDVRTIW